ncbi:MAG: 3,8-cyclase MoaA [Bacteroidota bacterium]
MLIDKHHRIHDYLRISLTDNCNLRCFYCMPNEDYHFMPHQQLMQPQEILKIAQTFVNLGVRKIRLTGGEPFVRKDAAEIIQLLGGLGVELAITTNGTRVELFLDQLEAAGIQSINISLDTLQREKFQLITGRDLFEKVQENIALLMQRGFKVKINVVVVKGLNDQEILDFVHLTKDQSITVRFIEFMPFDGNNWNADKLVTWQEMLQQIGKKHQLTAFATEASDTSKYYTVEEHQGKLAFITTMSAAFCSTCNRIRLTADGKIKNCLFSESESDLLGILRSGGDLEQLIQMSIWDKHAALGGQFSKDFEKIDTNNLHNRSMIAIGG